MSTSEPPEKAEPTDAPDEQPTTDPADETIEDAEGAESSESAESTDDEAPSQGSWVDFLPSPIFVLLLGVAGFAGWLSWNAVELDWVAEDTSVTPLIPPLLILLGWVLSGALHEFGHALAAYLAGDKSLRGSGYLRLNPFAYRETFTGTVLPVLYLGFGGFGMNGPASYIDWDSIPSRGRRVAVALAGPLVSLALSAGFALVVSILVPPGNDSTNWAIASMAFLSFANLSAALLNLLPIPGLDMFDAVAPKRPWVFVARANALFGSVAVFAVLWFPLVNDWFEDALFSLMELAVPNPVFPGLTFLGQLLLQFWAT